MLGMFTQKTFFQEKAVNIKYVWSAQNLLLAVQPSANITLTLILSFI